jgi:hypothetical protein
VSYRGSTENNIAVAGFMKACGIYRDPDEPDPARRYKAYVYGQIPPALLAGKGVKSPSSQPSIHRFTYSPDGIRWTEDPSQEWPIHAKVECSSRYRMHGKWIMSHQMLLGDYPQVHPHSRFVGVSTSEDGLHWQLAKEPAFFFDPRYQGIIQTHGTPLPLNYGNVAVGALGIFRNHLELPDQETDLTLVLTNDGLRWRQADRYQPLSCLLRRGDRGAWDESFLQQGSLVNVGEKTLLYYSAGHDGNASYEGVQIGVAMLRRDGFGYLAPRVGWAKDRDVCEGSLVTRPILIRGTGLKLTLNARGAVREGDSFQVELQDEKGAPIPGCSLEECDGITGDGLDLPVKWKGSASLDRLAGRRVRVHVRIRGANTEHSYAAHKRMPRLYAFSFR